MSGLGIFAFVFCALASIHCLLRWWEDRRVADAFWTALCVSFALCIGRAGGWWHL